MTREYDMAAAPEWGDDTSPRVERALEFIYSRLYHAYYASERIAALDEDDLRTLATARLDAHEYLDVDEHAELRVYEREIRRVIDSRGPAGVEDTTELDTAWCEILLDALEAGGDRE